MISDAFPLIRISFPRETILLLGNADSTETTTIVGNVGLSLILTIILSVAVSYALTFLLQRITGHLKLFLIISVLLLLYALGKMAHLSPLVSTV